MDLIGLINIMFLINQMTTKEQEKVTMAIRSRSEIPHPHIKVLKEKEKKKKEKKRKETLNSFLMFLIIKEKSMSGIPNDLLYAIMNKTDVGAFLSEKMRYP